MARDAKAAEWTALEETFARLAKRFARDAEVRSADGELLWDRGDEPRTIGEWKAAELIDSNQLRDT